MGWALKSSGKKMHFTEKQKISWMESTDKVSKPERRAVERMWPGR